MKQIPKYAKWLDKDAMAGQIPKFLQGCRLIDPFRVISMSKIKLNLEAK